MIGSGLTWEVMEGFTVEIIFRKDGLELQKSRRMAVGGRAEAAVREWKRKYLRGLSRLSDSKRRETRRKVKGPVHLLSLQFKMTVSHPHVSEDQLAEPQHEGVRVELPLLI